MRDGGLADKADAAVRRERMLSPGDSVIVGVSGGPDSMALLHYLLSRRRMLGLEEIVAAHVHHGLRGEDADGDEALVRRQCADWGIPCEIRRVNVADLARETGRGLEETGRRVRYAFFEELAKKRSSCRIATAHTAGDNLETLLLHLTRGSAMTGLAGIPPVRGRIIRPLIDCRRDEVEAYCREQGVPFRIDGSNEDIAYSRNRIRHRVTGELKALNPRVEEAARRLSETVRQEDAYLDGLAQAAYQTAWLDDEGKQLNRCKLREMPPALRRRVLEKAAAGVAEGRHLAMLDRLLEEDGALVLPGGLRVTARTEALTFTHPESWQAPSFFSFPLIPGDSYEICGRMYTSCILSLEEYENCKKIHKILLKNAFDYASIRDMVTIRQRLPGDAYHPVGRGGGKSLKKLFNEAGYSQKMRAETPVLCDEEGIVLVCGFGCDERVKIRPSTTRVLAFYQRNYEDAAVLDEGM